MKISEIKKEAEERINVIFWYCLKSNNKEHWIKAFDFIENQIIKFEIERWENLFIWRKVKNIMNEKYWKKFIKK